MTRSHPVPERPPCCHKVAQDNVSLSQSAENRGPIDPEATAHSGK
jgi:hypothetical protein